MTRKYVVVDVEQITACDAFEILESKAELDYRLDMLCGDAEQYLIISGENIEINEVESTFRLIKGGKQ
jgi:hypothetical protein